MFSFSLKKVRLPQKARLSQKAFKKVAFAVVPLILAGLLFASCDNNPGTGVNAQQPSITTQPSGGTFDVGTDETFELEVIANVTDDGELSYQWYSNTSNSTTGGTEKGTDSATLTLDKDDYTENTTCYFYVVVTNTNNDVDGNKTASVTSDVVEVIVDGVGGTYLNAKAPVIDAQPEGGTWDVSDEETFELTVEASVDDGGELTYQWYSTDSSTNTTDGTEIEDAESDTLTLAKADYDTDDDYYFYVVVTNTNNDADGNKTASRTSNVATVTVTGNSGGGETELVIPAEIVGFWQTEHSSVDSYWYTPSLGGFYADSFSVDIAEKKIYYYMDTTLETYWVGTIVDVIAESGSEPARLILQLTEVEGYWYTEPETGKYFAYAYKNVAGDIVSSAQPYSSNAGAKNTGADSKAEAISEYTSANGYYELFGTYKKRAFASPSALDGMQGIWEDDDDMDYFVQIIGTAYIEFMDDYEDGNIGFYDPDDDWDMLAVMGLIVDCTDTTQDSGVLYVQVLGSEVHSNFNFIAVGWRNKTATGIEFATSSDDYATLAAAKTAYGDASDFEDGNFVFTFTKK